MFAFCASQIHARDILPPQTISAPSLGEGTTLGEVIDQGTTFGEGTAFGEDTTFEDAIIDTEEPSIKAIAAQAEEEAQAMIEAQGIFEEIEEAAFAEFDALLNSITKELDETPKIDESKEETPLTLWEKLGIFWQLPFSAKTSIVKNHIAEHKAAYGITLSGSAIGTVVLIYYLRNRG